MINILIGLAALMLANILLGTSVAKFKNAFKRKNLTNGFLKALFLFGSILLTYLCAYLNPNIFSINLFGVVVNLQTAMNMIIYAIMALYANQIIHKVSNMFGLKVSDIEIEKSDE